MRLLTLLSVLILVGCPTPPSDVIPADPTVQPPPEAPPGGPPGPAAPSPEGAPPADPNAAGGPPPEGAPPPGDPNAGGTQPGGTPPASGGGETMPAPVDLTMNVAQQTQEVIKAGAHVTISGKITGTCAGTVQLIVIDAAPIPEGSQPKPGPVAVVDGASIGAYSIAVPKGGYPRVGAFCDANKDKLMNPTAGDKAAPQLELGKTDADAPNIDLAFAD